MATRRRLIRKKNAEDSQLPIRRRMQKDRLRYNPPPLISTGEYALGALVLVLVAFWVYQNFEKFDGKVTEPRRPEILGKVTESNRNIKAMRMKNQKTRKQWKKFITHRKRIFEIIDANKSEQRDSILIFGSGNCNDLQAKSLYRQFSNMSFVDIDIEATIQGIKRMIRPIPSWFQFHAADLTGAYHLLDNPEWQSVLEVINTFRWIPAEKGLNDLVLSTNLISSIITDTFIPSYERFADSEESEMEDMVVDALLDQHLDTMLLNLKPGGQGIVIFEVVSKITAPQIMTRRVDMKLVHSLVSKENFFMGMNPFAILEKWEHDNRVSNVKLEKPWVSNDHLVCAITFQKSSFASRLLSDDAV